MQLSSDHLRMMLLWELGLRKLAKMLILGLPLLLWVINHPLFLIQESQLFSQPRWIYSRLTSYLANRVKFQTLHDSWHRMPATRISCQGRVICWTFRTKMPTFSEFPVFLFRALTLYTLSNSVLRKIGGASFGVQWLRIACQCTGHSFSLQSGKILHASGQCTTTTEPLLYSLQATTTVPNAWSLCSATSEAMATKSLHTYQRTARTCHTREPTSATDPVQ